MTTQQLFILSEQALTNVFDQITQAQFSLIVPMNLRVPKSMQSNEINLKKLMNNYAYDDAWVPDTLAGKTIAELGNKYDGDLLGGNPKKNWDMIITKAVKAVRDLTDSDLERITHLSYGDYPVKDYLWHITRFRTFGTVDIAQFINVDASLPEDLIDGMWKILVPQAEMLRKFGTFGPEVAVSKNAPLYDRLLALSGRQPKLG